MNFMICRYYLVTLLCFLGSTGCGVTRQQAPVQPVAPIEVQVDVDLQADLDALLLGLQASLQANGKILADGSEVVSERLASLEESVQALSREKRLSREELAERITAIRDELERLNTDLVAALRESRRPSEQSDLSLLLPAMLSQQAALQVLVAKLEPVSPQGGEPAERWFDFRMSFADFIGLVVLVVSISGVFFGAKALITAFNFETKIKEGAKKEADKAMNDFVSMSEEHLNYVRAFGNAQMGGMHARRGWYVDEEILLEDDSKALFMEENEVGGLSDRKLTLKITGGALIRLSGINAVKEFLGENPVEGMRSSKQGKKGVSGPFDQDAVQHYKFILNNLLFYISAYLRHESELPQDFAMDEKTLKQHLSRLVEWAREEEDLEYAQSAARFATEYNPRPIDAASNDQPELEMKQIAQDMIALTRKLTRTNDPNNPDFKKKLGILHDIEKRYAQRFQETP